MLAPSTPTNACASENSRLGGGGCDKPLRIRCRAEPLRRFDRTGERSGIGEVASGRERARRLGASSANQSVNLVVPLEQMITDNLRASH
jgi:hypothetical protein